MLRGVTGVVLSLVFNFIMNISIYPITNGLCWWKLKLKWIKYDELIYSLIDCFILLLFFCLVVVWKNLFFCSFKSIILWNVANILHCCLAADWIFHHSFHRTLTISILILLYHSIPHLDRTHQASDLLLLNLPESLNECIMREPFNHSYSFTKKMNYWLHFHLGVSSNFVTDKSNQKYYLLHIIYLQAMIQ